MIELAASAGRISDKPGHDRVTVSFTPRHAQPVGYYQLDFDGSPIIQRGLMAGRGQRCGAQRSLRVPPDYELGEEITYEQTGGPPDATYPVDIQAAVDGAWL